MNRKGAVGEQLSGIYFIFLMVIVGGGIVLGVSIFYGGGYDYRESEANLLNYKVSKCILENEIDTTFFGETEFFEKCNLNREVLVKNNLLRICDGFNGDCLVNRENYISVGNNFNLCKLDRKESNFHICSINEMEKDGKKYVVVTGSNQYSRRERT